MQKLHTHLGRILVIFVMACFVFNMSVLPAMAQEQEPADVNQKLGLSADYDPVVPSGFFGKLAYSVKTAARDTQEGLYKTFASNTAYAQLKEDHANKQLAEAAKLQKQNPQDSSAALRVLEKYQDDVQGVKDAIAEVKKDNPEAAKQLSSEVAANHLFVAPQILNTLQDSVLANNPGSLSRVQSVRDSTLEAAGGVVVAVADSKDEVRQTLEAASAHNQSAPFSGILNAEVMGQTEKLIGGQGPENFRGAFAEAATGELRGVEQNLRDMPGSDSERMQNFQNFMDQSPGQGLERMKVMEQFRNQAELPPAMLQKMQEIKAEVAQKIGEQIRGIVEEAVRKAVSGAMFDVKNPGMDDLKQLAELQNLMPDKEMQKEIQAKREQKLQEFTRQFGQDQNAGQVAIEFRQLQEKVQSGQIAPDANFFKTMEDLKTRLSPEQRQFVQEAENSGRQELRDRAQNDQDFASRFSTSNPGDLSTFKEQLGGLDAKFGQLEQRQAENFSQFLGAQNRPKDVQALRQQFETQVPQATREKFEQKYNIDPQMFREREETVRQKFQEQERNLQPAGVDSRGGQGEFPGRGATQGQFPGQGATDGQFPGRGPEQKQQPNQGEFRQPVQEFPPSGSDNRGGTMPPPGEGRSFNQPMMQQPPSGGGGAPGPGGGGFIPPASGGGSFSAPPPSSGGGSAPASPPPGPVSFDPLGAIGQVLGLFIQQ